MSTTKAMLDHDSEENQSCKPIEFVELVKNEYQISDFNFIIVCRRTGKLNATPIIASIVKPDGSHVVIHYDRLEELIGKNCLMRLTESKTRKMPVGCYDVKVKGNSAIKIYEKETWSNGKINVEKIRFIKYAYFAIPKESSLMNQIEEEILAYDIPVSCDDLEKEIKIDFNDDGVFDSE